MQSTVRKIGISRGLILPQSSLKECFIEDEVGIEVKDNHIIICAPENKKRKGWEKAFKEMSKNEDDQLVIPDLFDDEEIQNWKW
jgi:antitoxin MazE